LEAAREAQYKANRIITIMMGTKIIPAVKVVLEDMGFEVGKATFPMKRYTDAEARDIIKAVKDAGFEY
jgi:dihydrodipicolinate synthase/N-acetylneuraminate lyase